MDHPKVQEAIESIAAAAKNGREELDDAGIIDREGPNPSSISAPDSSFITPDLLMVKNALEGDSGVVLDIGV